MKEPITLEQLRNASADAESLDIAINGDENTDVISRKGRRYPTLAKVLKLLKSAAAKQLGRVSSIAELRNYDTQINGARIVVNAYYEDGKMGGGEFIADLSDTSTLDDGGVCIVSTNGVRWKRTTSATVSAYDFGAVGDGVMDNTTALQNFLAYCRNKNTKGVIPAGTYLITSALDISGVDIEGVLCGYSNSDGTIIKGSGDHIILNQASASRSNITYSIRNLAIQNGSVGLRMTYSTQCRIENLFITECTDGIYCGVGDILGPLWNNFKNCRASVTGIALSINGKDWANANIFDTCVFKGGIAGGSVACTGGIGAVANHFINTELHGTGRGITLFNTKSTLFDNCYFESKSPAVVIDGYTTDASLTHCVFGSLRNNNADGIPSFIWHKSGTCQLTVNGGYIYLYAGDDRSNLRFIQSDVPTSFGLTMTDRPSEEISAAGWKVFGTGLPTKNDTLIFSANYSPTWTTSGEAPNLGDGILTGRYTLSGRICTVNVKFKAGSTTTFGTGAFMFSLPFKTIPAQVRSYGAARFFNQELGFFTGVVEVAEDSGNAIIYYNNKMGSVQSNNPFPWKHGDEIGFTITYGFGT